MTPDQPFPLEALPPRARDAILSEFEGRCPTMLEVARVSDAHWLATPGVGRVILAKIRDLTCDFPNGNSCLAGLTDTELLSQRDVLLAEFKRIESELETVWTELWTRGIDAPSTSSADLRV